MEKGRGDGIISGECNTTKMQDQTFPHPLGKALSTPLRRSIDHMHPLRDIIDNYFR